MTAFRVDHPVGNTTATTWHPTMDAALTEEKRLRDGGCERVVAWEDWGGNE